jgi:tetratricopeptide (TPR) repeat protein
MSQPLKLFVNYRRADERDFVEHMRTHFMYRYGRENVFMDFDTIPDFALFEDFIRKKVRECDALVAVIGPQWLTLMQAKQAAGEPDYVRIEIEEALKNNKIVAPICIQGASVPQMDDLPNNLRIIFDRNVARLEQGRHIIDNIGRIMNNLETTLGDQGTQRDIAIPLIDPQPDETFDIATARRAFLQARNDDNLPEALVWLQRIRESGAMLPRAFNLEKYETEIQSLLKEQEEARRRNEVAEYLYDFARDFVKFGDSADVIQSALEDVWEVDADYDPDKIWALVIALKGVEREPDDSTYYYILGNIYAYQNLYEDAISTFHKAIQLDPLVALLHNNLGFIYYKQGRYYKALNSFQRATELDPQYGPSHNGLGNIYAVLGHYQKGLTCHRKAVGLNPENPYYHYDLGRVYQNADMNVEATVAFQKAIELYPQFGIAYLSIAAIERHSGKSHLFDEYISKAREFIENSDHYARARLDSIIGNIDGAIRHLKKVLREDLAFAKTDPDFDFIRDDPRFRQLLGLDPTD